MVRQVQAFKSSTGTMFETPEEADKDEIRHATDALVGIEKNHLFNVAVGHSTCKSTREAILRLAQAIRELPIPAVAAPPTEK